MPDPQKIADLVRNFPGLARKKDILQVAGAMGPLAFAGLLDEDGASVRLGADHLLAATDAIMPEFCEKAPYHAGRSAVLASVNDVAAMGGKPLMLTNAVGAVDQTALSEITRGMAEAADHLGLRIDGGHLLPLGVPNSVSVTAIGRAKRLLKSSTLKSGQCLVLAVALEGKRSPVWQYGFDATFCVRPRLARSRYTALRNLAEEGLFTAGKDASNPGILGTLAILLETSGLGAKINLNAIPCPIGVPFEDWCLTFPSFCFILGVRDKDLNMVSHRLARHNIRAVEVGRATGGSRVVLSNGDREALLFDWNNEGILKK